MSKEDIDVPDNVPEMTVTANDVSNVPKLTIEARRAKVWDFRMRGVSVGAIAKVLSVSEKTIYDDLKSIGERYRDELLKIDPMELVASNLQWLDEMERIALHEVNQSQTQIIKKIDPQTGEVSEERIPDQNRSKFYQAALKARELKLKILSDTGILPKNRVELFDKLESFTKQEVISNDNRTEDEIKSSIERLMKHGRLMPSAQLKALPQ